MVPQTADPILARHPTDGQQVVAPVPEPTTTMLAGALLLLPFGASTIRLLRKQRVA